MLSRGSVRIPEGNDVRKQPILEGEGEGYSQRKEAQICQEQEKHWVHTLLSQRVTVYLFKFP
jgi:hypothetical protein